MEENKLIAYLSQHWSKILLGILVLATIGAWTERLMHSNQKESKQDFFIAQHIFDRFQKGEYLPSESIESVQNILGRHPELHPKFDVVLALTFFSQQKGQEASQYARSLISHADKHLPLLYKDYAHTTLLISEGLYDQALFSALSLQERLSSESDCSALGGLNTLRLLFLARQLNRVEEEKLYWSQLTAHPAYEEIASVFQVGNISLNDYFHLSS